MTASIEEDARCLIAARWSPVSPTYAFIGPLLPHFRQRPALLNDVFARLADLGARRIFVERLSSSACISLPLEPVNSGAAPDISEVHAAACLEDDRALELRRAEALVDSFGF